MGISDSKEADGSQKESQDPSDSTYNGANKSNQNGSHTTPGRANGKNGDHKEYSEEEKYIENTQSSYNDNDVINSQRGSNMGTPFRENAKRRQVFTAMTSRVLHNKENRKGLANSASNRYDKSNPVHKNIDHDGIEWVRKEDILETNLVSSKPYGSKHLKPKVFGPGSTSKVRLIKARSGVMTYLPSHALAVILSYDMSGYRKYMSVCASWHVGVTDAFDQYFNRVENEFVLKHQEHVLFTESFTSSAAIKFCGKRGLRVDRILV